MRHLQQLRLLPAFAHAAQLVLGGVGYLVPLAKQGERGRVRLREVPTCRQLVPFGGLERVGFDARGLGYRHVSSRIGNKKSRPEGRLQALHGLAHAVVPNLLRVLVLGNADRGRCHRRVLLDALEAERVAGRLRPRERGDDRDTVVRPVLAQRRAAVAVPLLHRVRPVHVQAEIWREHAVVAAQNVQVALWSPPHALELVVVDEEMAPFAALLVARRALREVEALKLPRLRARLWDAREPVPAAVRPRADSEVVRVVCAP